MVAPIDLSGHVYGKLTVLHEYFPYSKRRKWVCTCVCGVQCVIAGNNLRNGHTQSCGCYAKQQTSNANTTHGCTETRLYNTHQHMISRCTCPSDSRYASYGGRGIRVCAAWEDFSVFKLWAESHGYKQHLTIDRINNDGNYEPTNCRWATPTTQSRNRNKLPNKTSSYIGVSWHNTKKKWAANVGVNKKIQHIGDFINEKDAAVARDAYIKQRQLPDFKLNFN